MRERLTDAPSDTRVLVVADAPLQRLVVLTLNHGAWSRRSTSDLDEAEDLLLSWSPHLLIVDIDLRAGDASRLIGKRIGARRIPTIVITSETALAAKLDAFEKGADDFVVLPVTPAEIVARAIAVMRRTYGDRVPLVPVINVDGLEMDLLNHGVKIEGKQAELTPLEQAVLYLLVSNPGMTLDRSTILDSVWGLDYVADSNLVDRHIRNLRVKLRDDWRNPRFIRTIPGKGYCFVARQRPSQAP